MKLRVVMPVLNECHSEGSSGGGVEGSNLQSALLDLQALRRSGAELVVVDGGSTDSTWALARALADQVLLAPRGRAAQMNAGAKWLLDSNHAARLSQSGAGAGLDAGIGDAASKVLVFLHADTRLPPHVEKLIARALQQGHLWGRFDVRIDGPHPMLRVVERLMNLRSRLTGIATGDQAMFVRLDVFERLGGFVEMPVMEDIELSQRLKKLGPPACVRSPVVTSARRWQQHGVWLTILLMWWLRLAYFLGHSPQALALRYGYAPGPEPVAFAVAILAKAPAAGLAKTRLIPLLGAAAAARAQRRFVLNTLKVSNAAMACTSTSTPASASTSTPPATAQTPSPSPSLSPQSLTLWCAPDAKHRFFRALHRITGTVCINQPQGDIGVRMLHACANHFAQQADVPLLLVGTDCPALAPGHLQQAAQALTQHDVVLIPAEDGGYVLIGMRVLVRQVFEGITWSTPLVMAQTRDQLRRAGASWLELPTLWDVDEPADWQRLQTLTEPPHLKIHLRPLRAPT